MSTKLYLKPTTYWLIAILTLAAFFRLDLINQPFVDFVSWRQSDNATIADNFYQSNLNILYPQVSWNGPDPNYVGYEFQTLTYLAGLLYHFFGQHDWVGRIIPVLFGLWGIFALYQLVCCVWDEKRALVSSAVMAFLPGSIYIERSFISDPIMVSLVTTSFWLLVVYLQTSSLRFLALASLVGIWGFLTKISGLIVGIPMLYTMLTILRQEHRFNLKQLKLLIMASIIVLVPVATYYLWARHIYLNYPPHHMAAAGNWFWEHGFEKLLKEKYHLGKAYKYFNEFLWTKPVLFLVVLGLCLKPPHQRTSLSSDKQLFEISGKVSSEASSKAPWLFHWWILAAFLYYLVGAKELIDNPWNFQIISPAVAALTGHTITKIAHLLNRFFRFPAFLLVLTTLVLVIIIGLRSQHLSSGFNPYDPSMQEGYELGLALNKMTKPSELIVAIAEEIGNPVSIYYSKRKGWIFPPAWSGLVWWDDIAEGENKNLISLLEQLRNKGADWLGIVEKQNNKLRKSNPLFLEYLERTYKLKHKSSAGVIYRLLPPQEVSKS